MVILMIVQGKSPLQMFQSNLNHHKRDQGNGRGDHDDLGSHCDQENGWGQETTKMVIAVIMTIYQLV